MSNSMVGSMVGSMDSSVFDPLSFKILKVGKNFVELEFERRNGIGAYKVMDYKTGPGEIQRYHGLYRVFTIHNLTVNTDYEFSLDAEVYHYSERTRPVLINFRTVRAKPQPPSFFTYYDKTDNAVSFFWSPGTVDGGTARHEITRDGELLDIVAEAPLIDTNPQQGRNHVYCIRTVDVDFNYSESVCVTVSFEDFTAPTAPSNLRTSNLGLTLSWDESYDSSGDVTYIVDQGLDSEMGRTKETEFAVTGLELGKRYEFGVRATDKTGHLSDRVIVHYPALGIPVKGKP